MSVREVDRAFWEELETLHIIKERDWGCKSTSRISGLTGFVSFGYGIGFKVDFNVDDK